MKLQLDAAAQQFGNRVAQTYANEKGDTVMAFLRDAVETKSLPIGLKRSASNKNF